MPIYEYSCSNCGKTIDVLQKINDPAPAKCEQCGAENTLSRLVSRTSFVLKGGGWYADLYSSSKSKKDKGSSGEGGSSSSSSGSGSSGSSTSASGTSSSGSGGSSSSGSGGSSGGSGTSSGGTTSKAAAPA